jgi:ABC-type spermidine/putrescine transport system permease subunit I
MMVSAVIRAFGWLVLLGKNGLVNQALGLVGIHSGIQILYSQAAVVLALVQLVLPLMILPLLASMENIPIELEEAAANLGCNAMARYIKVLFPLSLPGLASGSVLCFTVAISVVITPAVLGGRQGRMVGNEIYDQVITGLNWPFASALAVLLMLGIGIALALGGIAVRRTVPWLGRGA